MLLVDLQEDVDTPTTGRRFMTTIKLDSQDGECLDEEDKACAAAGEEEEWSSDNESCAAAQEDEWCLDNKALEDRWCTDNEACAPSWQEWCFDNKVCVAAQEEEWCLDDESFAAAICCFAAMPAAPDKFIEAPALVASFIAFAAILAALAAFLLLQLDGGYQEIFGLVQLLADPFLFS